ncbi:MAG: DUF167 family protein [Victivallaceae bacterium]
MTLRIKVTPRAKTCGVFFDGENVSVRISEAPEKGRANDAVIAVLAEVLHLPKREIVIVSGHCSRIKTILVPKQALIVLNQLKKL